MGKKHNKNHNKHAKPQHELNIPDLPVYKPVLRIVDAPAVKIEVERKPEPKPAPRGETIKPVVHGGYQHSFQTASNMVGYSYTIYPGHLAASAEYREG